MESRARRGLRDPRDASSKEQAGSADRHERGALHADETAGSRADRREGPNPSTIEAVPKPGRAAKTGLAAPVLVLNRSFQPVRITTARHGFTLLYLGRARALDRAYEPHDFSQWASLSSSHEVHDGDEFVGTPRGRIRVPRVLLLSGYNRVPHAPLRLSRRNIFLRDSFTCQYCGRRPGTRELNLDHVMPRSRGGRSTWENLVTSCRDCNLRKGWATPDEAGMLLRSRPVRPGWSTALVMAAPTRRYVEWEPFLAGIETPVFPEDDDIEAAEE
ncbi:HNH endonuclease family protein [Sandaracinus amylolyticus]|uniref:HNH endonuclease family protein n=1 Tax=Sandaracinus amylolyticus TaxID=927083 RepID=A0A0F6SG10_9BACT|nr:HNH endonuclease family protein [Sandaracinus amylolyticus]